MPCGPGYWKTRVWVGSKSVKPASRSRASIRARTASVGIRSSAPIRGGPRELPSSLVK